VNCHGFTVKVVSQENSVRSPNAKRLTDNLSRKVNCFSFGSNLTAEKLAPHFYVPRAHVEENLTKNRRIATAEDISAKCEGPQSSGITKTSDRRFFEAATV
jgi:protein-tyrosine-phosphatase